MNYVRKKIWIDSFQTGLVLRIALYCLLCQAVAFSFNIVCDQIDRCGTALGADWSLFSNVFVRTALTFIVIGPPLFVDAIKFAHRLVGPLYRFRTVVRTIAEGQPVPMVQLRKGDFLMDLKDDFNAMLEQLERQGYVIVKKPNPATTDKSPAIVSVPTSAAVVPATNS